MTNETVTKSQRFYCVSLTPDICKTPVGSSTPPLPYTVIGEFSKAINASPNVKSHSEPVILHQRSTIPTVSGDAAGRAGGVKSGTVGKQVDTLESSSSHRANGAELVQVGRQVWMNSRNTVGKIYERGGEAARPTLSSLSATIRQLAQDYKEHGSKELHGAASDVTEAGGTILAGSAVVAVAGVAVAATGVGAPVAAGMETAAAVGTAAGGITVASGAAMEASATVLDQAADYVLTGKTPDVINTAMAIGINAAENIAVNAVLRRIPGGRWFAKKISKKIREKLVGKKPEKAPHLGKPPPKSGGDDGKSRGKKEPKSEPPSDCCPKDSGPAGKPVKGRKPVHFGTGQEVLYQTDFSLERNSARGLPIVWTRCYRSGSECGDWGLLGARWATPYTTSLSVCEQGIVYHDDTGRALRLPALAPGAMFDSRKEGFTLQRDDQDSFTLLWRDGNRDRFSRAGNSCLPHGFNGVNAMLAPAAPVLAERFVLVRFEQRDGHGVSIDYLPDALPGTPVLRLRSDDGSVLEAICGEQQADEPPRIERIEELGDDGSRLCHVRYDYASEAATTPVSGPRRYNLVRQSNLAGDSRSYSYQHHLLTACTSYTGFAYALEWISLDALRASWRGLAHDQNYPITLDNSYQARATLTRALDGSELIRIDYIDPDTTRVAENGGVLEYTFDANWLATEVRRINDINDGASATSLGRREWDRDGMLLAEIDANGAATRHVYDQQGNLVSSVDALGNRYSIDYDEHNQPVLITDALGHGNRRSYDDSSRLLTQTDVLGHTTSYRYDAHGQLVEVIDAKGGHQHLQYNGKGQLVRHTDCSGYSSRYHYDRQGRLSAVFDALEHATHYAYDVLGRLTSIKGGDGDGEQFEYDADGNLLVHLDAAGHATRYQYNGQGLPVQRTDAIGQVLRYRYDGALQLVELVNAKGESYTLTYHAEGWLASETGFDGKLTEYTYDQAGNLRASQSGKQRTELVHDVLKRLVAKTTADGITRYAYDCLSRLIAVSSPQAEQRYLHDARGQLIEERSACFLQTLPAPGRMPNAPRQPDASFIMTHAYDELGNRIQTVLPNGRRIDILRYGAGHWHGMLWHGRTVVDVERDSLHREKLRRLGNSGLTATRQYDRQQRLARMTLARGPDAPSPLRERRFDYDAAGNLTTIIQTGNTPSGPLGNLHYTYDPIGQLLSAVQPGLVERFAFDPAGNMIAPASDGTLSAVKGDRLEQFGDIRYDYDEQGNTIRKRVQPPGREVSWSDLQLQYDAENRISFATRKEGRTRHHAQYFYDAFSRRIAKRVAVEQWGNRQDISTDQPLNSSSATTLFVWDGDVLAQELTLQGTVSYIYEPDSFVPIVRIASEGGYHGTQKTLHLSHRRAWNLPIKQSNIELQAATVTEEMDGAAVHQLALQNIEKKTSQTTTQDQILYYNCDHLGTPHEVLNKQGEMIWKARYNAWGAISEIEENRIFQPLRFQGQYEDIETGIFYNRYRYYDASCAIFFSQDPIGLLGGINNYAYCLAPTSWVDPLGLSPKCPKNSPCNPCIGKRPDLEAMAMQGTSNYPNNPYAFVDSYKNMVLKKGTILYSLTPGSAPGFGVTNHTLIKAAGNVVRYHDLTQVTAGKDSNGNPRAMRKQVQAYRVNEDICVAKGEALANKQFGAGGATQYYVSPTDIGKLTPGKKRNI